MHMKFTKGLLAAAGMFLLMGCPPEPEETGETDTYQMMRVKSPDAGWRIEVIDPTQGEVKDLRAK